MVDYRGLNKVTVKNRFPFGGVMQVEEQKGEAKVREPRDQSMQGLYRDSQGKPSTIPK